LFELPPQPAMTAPQAAMAMSAAPGNLLISTLLGPGPAGEAGRPQCRPCYALKTPLNENRPRLAGGFRSRWPIRTGRGNTCQKGQLV
jgi:hypothetical protein